MSYARVNMLFEMVQDLVGGRLIDKDGGIFACRSQLRTVIRVAQIPHLVCVILKLRDGLVRKVVTFAIMVKVQ